MDIWKFVMAYKNYPEVLFNVILNRKSKAELRDGRTVYLSAPALKALSAYYREMREYPREIEDCEGECKTQLECFILCFLKYHEWKTKDNYMYKNLESLGSVKFLKYYKGKVAIEQTIHEIFDEQIYNDFREIKGDVVDIGAGIGDSPIFFALWGASKVLGIEPLPTPYNVALENIKLNELNNRVRILNAIINYESRVVKIKDHDVVGSAGVYVRPQKSDIAVKSVTISDLVRELDNPFMIKMDCEGCEYDILRHEKELLKYFEKIIMEYHKKPPIKEVEELGFSLTNKNGKILIFYRKK